MPRLTSRIAKLEKAVGPAPDSVLVIYTLYDMDEHRNVIKTPFLAGCPGVGEIRRGDDEREEDFLLRAKAMHLTQTHWDEMDAEQQASALKLARAALAKEEGLTVEVIDSFGPGK